MKTSYFGIFDDASPYRNCEADEIRRHPASVLHVDTASHRDSYVGLRVFTGRVDFADGAHADFRYTTERERDAFAAEFAARIERAA